MTTYEKVCEYCGKPFEAHRKNKVFCSRKCKDISFRLRNGIKCNPNPEPYHKICCVCGKAFASFRKAEVTCSSECAKKYHSAERYKKGKPAPKKCVICGEDFTPRFFRQVTCGNADCISANRYERYNRKRREDRAKKAKDRPPVILEEKECAYCGALFISDPRIGKKYCGEGCAKSASRERRGRKDKRIPKAARVDRIDIHRLFTRDGGKCYICGCGCDWDDWRAANNGNKYPGDSYPTIDHVIPVSKGGLDSWANVRLACWKCNTLKSDSVIDAGALDVVFAYSQKPKGTQAKKTAQYTLAGELVKVWESTAQIRRELGLNDKHIQSVCKGYKSNTGNAYGYHWEYVNG